VKKYNCVFGMCLCAQVFFFVFLLFYFFIKLKVGSLVGIE